MSTLVGALMLRPLPFPDADRLTRIWFEEPGGSTRIALSIPEYNDFKTVRAFDAFLGTARVRVVALLGSGAERMRGEGVSRGYFETLGIRPSLGRALQDSDHEPGTLPALVLSHGAWVRLFGSDRSVIGREMRTTGAVYTIVGVAPQGFDGSVEDDIVEFFVPIEHYEPRSMQTSRRSRPGWAIARLAPGASMEQARTEIAAVGRSLAAQYPDIYRNFEPRIEPMGESWRAGLRRSNGILFVAAAVLLLIAALNVGSLLVARVLVRRRELAVRSAIGADPRRLMLQLFTEASILVVLGGGLGIVMGPLVLDAFLAMSPVVLPHYVRIEPDAWTMALAIGVLSIAGLIAGTVPALIGRSVRPIDVLREGGRGTIGGGVERRWTTALIAGETALTLVLLVAGGLLVRSLDRLETTDLGFDRSRIARLAVTLSPADVAPDQLPAFYVRLRETIAAHPGVSGVGLVAPTLPPWDGQRARVTVQGLTTDADDNGVDAGVHYGDHGLLPLLDATVVAGRGITANDTADTASIAVVSESLARLLGGPERALGRSLRMGTSSGGPSTREYRIAGVARDIAYDGLVEQTLRRYFGGMDGAGALTARFDVYLPLAQTPDEVVSIGVKTAGDPAAIIAPIRKLIASLAPASAVHWVGVMNEEVALEYAASRFYSMIVLVFSLSALLLTSIGLFALLARSAAQRVSEMGLRLALGATPTSTGVLLLRSGVTPVVIGVAVGLAGAIAVGRSMRAMLFGVAQFDLLTFGAAVVCLLIVCLLAGLIPARRAARVDPIIALRQ